jgi:hypothetical protein
MTQSILVLLRLDRKRLKKLNVTINTLKIKSILVDIEKWYITESISEI